MLQISNLAFSYQNQILLQNLNLSFSSPEIIAIIGDNGSGKTTLLRLIAGELTPDEGAIKAKGQLGFLHQSPISLSRQLDSDPLLTQSGGERTYTELNQLFRQHPDILLLDEPTNNLDSEHRAWLIQQLSNYRGLVLVVSHDRNFIDQVADRVLQIKDSQTQLFAGNYASFCAQQSQKAHEQSLLYTKTQREKKKLSAQLQVAANRAHKSNRRAFDKIRDESKFFNNAKRMAAQNSAGKVLRATQSKLDQLSKVEKPFERKSYQASVSSNFLHHKKLLEVTDLSKSYPEKPLFSHLNFTIHTGERVRISGRNGSGKSTLFKIIMQEIAPDTGTVNLLPNLSLEYISQDSSCLDPQQSFITHHADFDKTKIYQAATTMDLTPSDLTKPINKLSRGQQVKLAILRLILRPLDLVILDELTNHLDIRARENIESALANYPGAILAATHDEAFAKHLNFNQEISL